MLLTEIFQDFAKLFPSHPYTNQIVEMLNAINSIKVGSKFIDFSASTIDGKLLKISELIMNKVAVIDLWSSWCGSCRANSNRTSTNEIDKSKISQTIKILKWLN